MTYGLIMDVRFGVLARHMWVWDGRCVGTALACY